MKKAAVSMELHHHPWWAKLTSETGEHALCSIGQDAGEVFTAFPVSSADLRDMANFLLEAATLMDRAAKRQTNAG